MSDDPCKKLEEEFKAAELELLQAHSGVQAFQSDKPIDQIDDIPPKNGQELDQAHKRFDIAKKKYDIADEALSKCRKKHKKITSSS